MKRKLTVAAALLVMATAALAVDNTLLVTPCAASCVTTRSKDVGGGVQAPMPVISDVSGNPIYGTAGTANANILTVQGIAAMTPLLATLTGANTVATVTNLAQMNGAALLMGNGASGTGSQRVNISNDNTLPPGWASSVAQGSTTSGQTGPLTQCAVTTAAPTYTTAQTSPVSCDTAGNQRVNIITSVLPTGAATAANQTTLITAVQAPLPGVSKAKTTTAASSLVAKAAAGAVVSITGSAATGAFIMLFDAASAPADGAVTPDKCWGPMAAAGPFVFSWGAGPTFTAATGITVVSSSTGCFTKTAVNAPFISVEFQ